MSHENIMRLWNAAVTLGGLRPRFKIIAKTSDYTVTPNEFGSVFTTRGAAAAVTFTLPAAGSTNKGDWVLFTNVADYNMVVSGADEGLVVFNNLTADNIGFGTPSELIGGTLLAISDGTSWIVLPLASETQTLVIDSSPTSTATSTATATATTTATATATATTTSTATSTATSTGTATQSATMTMSTTGTDTASETATVSATRTSTASPTATATSTSTATATATTTSTSTSTATSTATATATP